MAGDAAGVERTVRAVVTTYVHPDGAPRVALRGETVQVHPDGLERFDASEALVPPLPDELVAAELAPEPESEFSPEEPPRAGRGSGLDAWATYARLLGLEVADDATRDEVIALVDEHNAE